MYRKLKTPLKVNGNLKEMVRGSIASHKVYIYAQDGPSNIKIF